MFSGDGQQTDELISSESSATEVRGTSLIVNGQLAGRFTDLERPARGVKPLNVEQISGNCFQSVMRSFEAAGRRHPELKGKRKKEK